MFGGRGPKTGLRPGDRHHRRRDDIRQATNLARGMVTEFGFSDKLGPLRYSENEEEVFLGHSVTHARLSDATAKVIDEEIRRLVEDGEATARRILTEHIDELHVVAKGLLEFETLTADEIHSLIRGEPIRVAAARTAPARPAAVLRAAAGAPPASTAGRTRAGWSPSRNPAANRRDDQ